MDHGTDFFVTKSAHQRGPTSPKVTERYESENKTDENKDAERGLFESIRLENRRDDPFLAQSWVLLQSTDPPSAVELEAAAASLMDTCGPLSVAAAMDGLKQSPTFPTGSTQENGAPRVANGGETSYGDLFKRKTNVGVHDIDTTCLARSPSFGEVLPLQSRDLVDWRQTDLEGKLYTPSDSSCSFEGFQIVNSSEECGGDTLQDISTREFFPLDSKTGVQTPSLKTISSGLIDPVEDIPVRTTGSVSESTDPSGDAARCADPRTDESVSQPLGDPCAFEAACPPPESSKRTELAEENYAQLSQADAKIPSAENSCCGLDLTEGSGDTEEDRLNAECVSFPLEVLNGIEAGNHVRSPTEPGCDSSPRAACDGPDPLGCSAEEEREALQPEPAESRALDAADFSKKDTCVERASSQRRQDVSEGLPASSSPEAAQRPEPLNHLTEPVADDTACTQNHSTNLTSNSCSSLSSEMGSPQDLLHALLKMRQNPRLWAVVKSLTRDPRFFAAVRSNPEVSQIINQIKNVDFHLASARATQSLPKRRTGVKIEEISDTDTGFMFWLKEVIHKLWHALGSVVPGLSQSFQKSFPEGVTTSDLGVDTPTSSVHMAMAVSVVLVVTVLLRRTRSTNP
ncbi:hypothetical protein CYMTET_13438 [Cymbomonas tetramitiformis]|uniref:Uncharacterized protein n=1 Tax=Cymbomonas tetramitiformis TaxID=36881 RepID=A0AAE0GI52_9CHLO|nr:hypothetical protein CYMTET_13438 [Cymbomonas tetramitiformis]